MDICITIRFFFLLLFLGTSCLPVYGNLLAEKCHLRKKNIILSSIEQEQDTTALETHISLPIMGSAEREIQKTTQPVIPVAPQRVEDDVLSQQKAELLQEIKTEEQKQSTPVSIEELRHAEDEEDTIEFNFENASLEQLVDYVSDIFNYTFLKPDMFEPVPASEKKVKGNLITFKTNQPLSKKEAWALFVTFLDMAGFAIVPEPLTNVFRIMPFDGAKREPVPTFIGIDPQTIPATIANTDQLIRYVYFIKNTNAASLKPLLDQMKSPQSEILALEEHNALVFVDRAYNIINLMQIVQELDKVSMPQAMSVLKLRQADAMEVKQLYDALIKPEDQTMNPNRLFQRKQPSSLYFPENVKILAEPRTNSLIILGPKDAIAKIEDFIIEYVDISIDKPFSPLYVYQLQYANAQTVVNILKDVTKIGESKPDIRATGGIRGTDKYFKPMDFTAELSSNRIIIKGDYEDYIKVVEIIKQLDQPQPQVAIEVLVLAIDVAELKILGTQMRSREPGISQGLLGNQVVYQTSGLFSGALNAAQGVVTNPVSPSGSTTVPGVQRLLGDLINLATSTSAGNTLVSLGDSLGVWALIQALESLASTQVVANPFLLATNKTKANVKVGNILRVVDSQIVPTAGATQNTFKDEPAFLEVVATPQINSDGMISLDLRVKLDNFVGDTTNPALVQKQTREVATQTIVANGEVIAIGGLIQNTTQDTATKVPVLGDIPILGWLFKNRKKANAKTDLLILVGTQIIPAEQSRGFNEFTRRHINAYEGQLGALFDRAAQQDPIHRFFFEDTKKDSDQLFDDFIFNRHKKERVAANKQRQKRRKRFKNTQNDEGKTSFETNGAVT